MSERREHRRPGTGHGVGPLHSTGRSSAIGRLRGSHYDSRVSEEMRLDSCGPIDLRGSLGLRSSDPAPRRGRCCDRSSPVRSRSPLSLNRVFSLEPLKSDSVRPYQSRWKPAVIAALRSARPRPACAFSARFEKRSRSEWRPTNALIADASSHATAPSRRRSHESTRRRFRRRAEVAFVEARSSEESPAANHVKALAGPTNAGPTNAAPRARGQRTRGQRTRGQRAPTRSPRCGVIARRLPSIRQLRRDDTAPARGLRDLHAFPSPLRRIIT
jgi:hypothetical protein